MDFGICSLSIVPVRAEPSDRAEITTQLIFGDLFEVIETHENKNWIKIRIESDGYEGWIDFKQKEAITGEEYEKLKTWKRYKTSEAVTAVFKNKEEFLVVAGSTFYTPKEKEKNYFGAFLVNTVLKDSLIPSPDEIIPLAKSYLNAPYLWGGKSHFGIDCSGFMQQVYGICGYKLPRDAWQQEEHGNSVQLKDSVANDLAFFANENERVVHVGIVMGNKKIIHASGKVRIDILDEIGIFNEVAKEYSHKLHSIKRIIK